MLKNTLDSTYKFTLIIIFFIIIFFGDNIIAFFNEASNIQMAGFYGLTSIVTLEIIIKIKFFESPKYDHSDNNVFNILNFIIRLFGNIFIKIIIIVGLLTSISMMAIYFTMPEKAELSNYINAEIFENLIPLLFYPMYLYLIMVSFYAVENFMKLVQDYKNIESSNERLSLLISIGAIVISFMALLS